MRTLSSPPPLQSSRFSVFPTNPPQIHKFIYNPFLIFLIFTLTPTPTTSTHSQFPQIPYSPHCNYVVAESPPTNTQLSTPNFLKLLNAYFTGGEKILSQNHRHLRKYDPNYVSLQTKNVYQTQNATVFKLDGILNFWGSRIFRRNLRLVHYRPPKIPVKNHESVFRLSGFWDSSSGKLCMVGSGLGYLRFVNVVLKLNYLNSSSIFTSLVNGTLQSLDTVGGSTYFEPISILGVSSMSYEYTLIDKEIENNGFRVYDKIENVSLGLELNRSVCFVIDSAHWFEMENLDDCGRVNCNPISGGSKDPFHFMSFHEIECLEDGKVRYLIMFWNLSRNAIPVPFDPYITLVGEGAWDWRKRRFNMVACRILNITDSLDKGSVGDCSIRLSLHIPSTLSLRNRSFVVGQMWSTRSLNDSSYFGTVAFQSPENRYVRLKGLNYEYSENDNVGKQCAKKMTVKGKGGRYPDVYSSDMRFDMRVRNRKGVIGTGYSSPLYVGDKLYEHFDRLAWAPEHFDRLEPAVQLNHSRSSVVNISSVISFRSVHDFKLDDKFPQTRSVEISAEGIYDPNTGLLCMIGCMHLGSHKEKLSKNVSVDCEIVVNVQYPQLDLKAGTNAKGTIESTRSKSDHLYFEHLEFHSYSIYTSQAKESIWRMDLEITMVLISNTLACLFVGLQLFYVKKHPDVLPFISVMMIIVLTVAHMIPLLLNFEALFLANRNRQNVFLGSDGWLEVNEVLVRVITMIAFLMQFRLLQLTWSARVGGESQRNLRVADKKVFYLSLPLYIGGGLIALFALLWKKSHQSPFLRPRRLRYQQQSFWGDLKSYAGLVLDGFLLPQILFNLFCDSRERALAPAFYTGTTLVRLLPHVYDLYRARSSSWFFDNIFANPRMDYYSTTWDIIISCSGLVFVCLVYLQQQFGGRCFLPKKYRENSIYEKVPVVGTE
ncbi:unnamed protein product [Ilex paraguariensis]|uniref:RING-type E3 ubiquitin transferase n=1 Tax=Ilex paraguariensis TaxID=185542 RepID=A0ABC8UL83_9AQUA